MGAYKAYRAGRIVGAFQQGERGAVLIPVTDNIKRKAVNKVKQVMSIIHEWQSNNHQKT